MNTYFFRNTTRNLDENGNDIEVTLYHPLRKEYIFNNCDEHGEMEPMPVGFEPDHVTQLVLHDDFNDNGYKVNPDGTSTGVLVD